MSLRLLPSALATLLLLPACDPGVHLGFEKDFEDRVDDQCVEQALKTVSPEATRTTYISEGGRGFPRGTEVIQFNYPDPVTHYGYSLDLALLPNGETHYAHQWSKIGTNIPANEQLQVLPLLKRANETVARVCGLSFDGLQPEVGSG